MLLSRSNLRISSPDSLRSFLEDDIRFDFDAFGNPDKTILKGMAESGHKPLCDYPNKDALLAAEPDEVKKVVDFSQNGTNYPAVVLSWIGFCRLVPQYSSMATGCTAMAAIVGCSDTQKSAESIGIIGGDDGPTATWMTTRLPWSKDCPHEK